jgi:glycosyltransferase involved in cell wall biosynthesis
MQSFWLFRSNLIPLEYYHKYKDLKSFEDNCHDYYMLLSLWLLNNNLANEIIIWRLTKDKKEDIVFDVNGKKYIQRWVCNFRETLDYPSPDVSFWRGGFKEYDQVTKMNPNHFGMKLYLGAGIRQYPQYGGKYDHVLIEDERDIKSGYSTIPFYKTASPKIFKPLPLEKVYDICWPCNFTQIKYKGQEKFMSIVSKTDLKNLRIAHCGNKPEIGKKLAKKYNLSNIDFLGPLSRPELNIVLNKSKLGLNFSNLKDGCPRVSTEILRSGTPLILRDTVRLLKYFKDEECVINVTENNVDKKIKWGLDYYDRLRTAALFSCYNKLSFDNINNENYKEWQKI